MPVHDTHWMVTQNGATFCEACGGSDVKTLYFACTSKD